MTYQSGIKTDHSTDTFNQTDYSTSDEEEDDDFDLSTIPDLEDAGTFSPILSPESSQHSQQDVTHTLHAETEWSSLAHDQSRNLFSTQQTNEICSQ